MGLKFLKYQFQGRSEEMEKYRSNSFLDARPRNGLKVCLESVKETVGMGDYLEITDNTYIGAGDRIYIDDPNIPGIIRAWFLKGV